MPVGRRRLEFDNTGYYSEPERSLHRRRRENRAMATPEELARQLEVLQTQMEALKTEKEGAAAEAERQRAANARLQEYREIF